MRFSYEGTNVLKSLLIDKSGFGQHKSYCILFVSQSFVYSVALTVVAVFIGSDHKAGWVAQHVADADRLPIALIQFLVTS